MASSFPKMQKSSASFSQSIRNLLRLKKLQAQAWRSKPFPTDKDRKNGLLRQAVLLFEGIKKIFQKLSEILRPTPIKSYL